MFGRIKNVGNTHNSFETVDKFSNSRDSENISLIHTPPTVLIRYVAPLLFMRFIQYMIINSTKLLILDYKQFKAARLLQKIIRGWLVRHEMKKRNNAALVIQRAWLRYIAKRFRSSMAQQILQTYIVDSFNHKSIKIQALFRGWHSRRRIYNMRHLAIIQKQALEELLTNMVHKMHKINQRNELPGVFSFCDNRWVFISFWVQAFEKGCLLLALSLINLNFKSSTAKYDICIYIFVFSENIEKFLTTLTYRIYNCYVGKNINLLKTLRDERRVDFLNSVHYTKLPFIGAVENCAQLVKPEMFVREGKPYSIKDFDIAEAFLAGNHPKTKIKNKRIMCE